MTEPDFLLTPRQFEVVWQELGLGRLPYPLDVPSNGDTAAERRRLREDVLAELGGYPSDRLTDLLRLLAGPEIAVDAVAHIGRPIRALAASDLHHGVLAVLDDGVIGLTEIRPTSLAKSVVDLLPEKPSGPGSAHTLTVDTLDRAVMLHENHEDDEENLWGDDELDERAALVKAGVPGEDANALAELAASRIAGGQFGVSCRDGSVVDRSPVLITWFDTHQGRYLMVRDDQWLSVAPADNDRIRTRVAAILSTMATDHHHRIASIR